MRLSVFFGRLIHFGILLSFAIVPSVLGLALGRWGLIPLPPTVLALFLFMGLAGAALVNDLMGSYPGREILKLFKHTAVPLVSYTLLALISLAWSALPRAYWQEDAKYIFIIFYGYGLWVLVLLTALYPSFGSKMRGYLLLPLILLGGSIIYELWYPATFSTVESRAAGFPGNSNYGAFAFNMLLSAVLSYGAGKVKMDIIWLIAGGICIFATQSRSGLVGYLVIAALYCIGYLKIYRFSIGRMMKMVLAFLVVLAILIVIGTLLVENTGLFTANKTRFAKVLDSGRSDDGSADSRLQAAKVTINRIEQSVVFGYGTGFTRTFKTQPHNMYLQQWVNNGIPGLVIYLCLLAGGFYVFYRIGHWPGMGFISVVAVGGMFSHNVLEQHNFIVTYAVLLADSFFLEKRRKA